MITKTINLYTFDELSEKAKEKALNAWRENDDMPFLETDMQEHFEELLKKHNMKEVSKSNLQYSLSYCQGDGVSFTGNYKWKNYNVEMIHTNTHYYHKYTVSIDITTMNDNDAKESIYDSFKSIYESICDELEKIGYSYIDDSYNDTNIIETIESNGYHFTNEGIIDWEI